MISNIAELNAVYPRWRGELLFYSARTGTVAGLSPLARGTLISLAIINRLTRFIPAGAGNSVIVRWTIFSFAVYPRWRGELSVFGITFGFGCGLSPLARGTRAHRFLWVTIYRFIPAGAGNSHNPLAFSFCPTVYPRWRGELSSRRHSSRPRPGLSPLARGTPVVAVSPSKRCRFIPAGAGNSLNITYY